MTYAFQKYTNLKKIKEGGTSTVWWAKPLDGKKPVALKILRDDLLKNREVRKAFYREGSIMMAFDHPYVMRVSSVLSAQPPRPNPTLVMPYFPSENMKMLMVREPELIERNQLKIAIQTVESLIYVHEQKIIHKDIKPENLLVDANGDIRLIDFSLADQRKWYSNLNVFQRVKIQGTPSYLPPEQIRKDPIEYSADTYSLGVTFYEMFTGRLPFVGASQDEILSQHLKAKPKPPHMVKEGVDRKVSDLIMAMLEKKPGDRPRDMQAVLSSLKQVPGAEEVKAHASK